MNQRMPAGRMAVATAVLGLLAACGGGGGGSGQGGGAEVSMASPATLSQPSGSGPATTGTGTGTGTAPAASGGAASAAPLGIATADGHQVAPSVARLADGSEVLAWLHQDAQGEGGRIRLQRRDAGGADVGPALELAGGEGLAVRHPSVAALADGGYVLSWTSGDAQAAALQVQVRAQRFDAAGSRVGVAIDVSVEPSRFFTPAQVAGLSDGGFAVAWTSDTGAANDPMRLPYLWTRRFDASGAATMPVQRLRPGYGPQPAFALAAQSDGGFAIAWTQWLAPGSTAIHLQRFNAPGAAIGSELRIDDAGSPEPGQPALAQLADGQLVVAWDSGLPNVAGKVRVQRLTATGTTVGAPVAVQAAAASPVGTAPGLAPLADGGYAVHWLSAQLEGADVRRDTRVQRFSANGAATSAAGSLGSSRVAMTTSGSTCGCSAVAQASDGSLAFAVQGYSVATGWDLWIGRR